MRFQVDSNIDELTARMDRLLQVKMPLALSTALTKTAFDIYRAEQNEMRRAFDRPTPWTLKAFMVKPATPDNLVAIVQQKDVSARRNYLARQAIGGTRANTGFENQLKRHAPGWPSWDAVVPGRGAELDSYGNWRSGERTKVMAALGAMADKYSNQTKSSRATKRASAARHRYHKLLGLPVPTDPAARSKWETDIAKADRNGRRYFVPSNGLKPAVYSRDSSGQLRVILAFTARQPTYEKRFYFADVAMETGVDRMPGHAVRALNEALNT